MELFDETRIFLAAEGMPSWKKIAFMAYCCERMLPNYRSFQADTGYGDEASLRKALDTVWEWVVTGHAPQEAAALVSFCEQQAPDTAEFSSIYTSAALDATTATIATLEAIADATTSRVIEVASLARDTIDLFVQEQEDLDPNAQDLERRIIENTFMQTELRAQRESLEALNNLHEGRKEAGSALQAKWSKLKQGSLPDYRNIE